MESLYIIPILLFSVVIHELAHGWMALRLGDPTARDMGRLTLNPIPHIDLFGSILVPLFSFLAAGQVFIAWAKPVPVNPYNFSDIRRDDRLVSIAGPLSNLAMALACTIAVIALSYLQGPVKALNVQVIDVLWQFFLAMFAGGISLNIVLAVFNLIPIPPLDGSHVLASYLPDETAARYQSLGFYGVFLVILLMRLPPFRWAFYQVIGMVSLPYQALLGFFAGLS